jgi:hypothetical protein
VPFLAKGRLRDILKGILTLIDRHKTFLAVQKRATIVIANIC